MFLATGYLVGTGHSPYVAQDLTQVFHHVGFRSISVVGYPPPWPLLLGLIYRGTFALGHNFVVYNLAIKLPVIAANLGLAYLVAAVLENLGAGRDAARKAWTFLLLNPFLLYVGAAWGQIDAIVAVLAVAAPT
jgi:Gpi18-like mannosyltransferase